MAILLVLIALLAHPRFTVRESAQRILHPVNEFSLPIVEYYEKHHFSLEGRRRCGQLVNRYYQANARAIASRLGRMPWVDGGGVVCGWGELLAEGRLLVPVQGGPDYAEYAMATRLWVEQRIAARMEYQSVLRELWRWEWAWRWRATDFPWCR